MSQSNFESGDVPAASTPGTAAAAARSSFSEEFVQSVKNALTKPSDSSSPATGAGAGVLSGVLDAVKNAKPSDSSNPATGIGAGVLGGVADAIKNKPADASPAPSLGNLLKDAIKNGADNVIPRADHGLDQNRIKDGGELSKYIDKGYYFGPITDKDRSEAKESLAKGMSELIPEADRAMLKQMQGALIDGNLDKFKESLAKLADDPAKMEKVLKEINGQLKREGANVELSTDGKGNVLVYDKNGNTAVSVNPKSGETTLRAIERQNDGSILLKPGEIINRKPAEVMKTIGDDATRDITRPFNNRWDKYPIDRLYELHNQGSTLKSIENSLKGGKGGGGGGGGGKGHGDNPSAPQSPTVPNAKGILENLLPEVKKKEK